MLTVTEIPIPASLQQIAQPPRQLFAIGNRDVLDHHPKLAVVGSRKLSIYGKQITEQLTLPAARKSVVIVSGLALGADAVAHTAALEAGGATIAVLPCGLDSIYPAANRQLARRIVQNNGLLISEYPIGTPPLQHHFIARNRIVSGLSDAVLITEAAAKSGTLHTANFALEQGKTVLAVPGNITSELSKGTNTLIKSGAIPVTSPEDIYDALGIEGSAATSAPLAANEAEAVIIQLLMSGVTDGSELLESSQLDATAFNQTLTMLEISGKIRPIGAGHWSIR